MVDRYSPIIPLGVLTINVDEEYAIGFYEGWESRHLAITTNPHVGTSNVSISRITGWDEGWECCDYDILSIRGYLSE